jgi:hypothetical protein
LLYKKKKWVRERERERGRESHMVIFANLFGLKKFGSSVLIWKTHEISFTPFQSFSENIANLVQGRKQIA